VAETREHRHRDAADAAGGASDCYPRMRWQSALFDGQDAQGRGEAGGAGDHGGARVPPWRRRQQRPAVDALALGIGAPARFAHAFAGGDHGVAGFPVSVGRVDDGAAEVDARDHGKAAHDRGGAGDGEGVLVVHR